MFGEISANITRISKLYPDDPFRIDEHGCPEASTTCSIKNPVCPADDLCSVTDHWVRHIFQGRRCLFKHPVAVYTVRANRHQICTQSLNIRVNSGDRRQFCRSNESEIAWVEK